MAYQHDKHDKGAMRLHGKRRPFFVNSVKMPLVRVKFVKIPVFFVNSVKIHTGKNFTKICLWVMTNIRYVKDNQGDSLSLPPLSLVE